MCFAFLVINPKRFPQKKKKKKKKSQEVQTWCVHGLVPWCAGARMGVGVARPDTVASGAGGTKRTARSGE